MKFKDFHHYPTPDFVKGIVEFKRHEWNPNKEYPYCSEHGAMNKVSKHGMWRCLACHIGFNEETGEIFSGSTEGFRK